jgi:molecular chaperone HscB
MRGERAVLICWSCEKSAGEGVTCAGCGAVQPPDSQADHFQVLGVERRFAQDMAALERRYKDLTRILHPDRFARADPRARRASLARTVQLNDAWRTIKDPVRRAEYLLKLAGLEVGGEEGTTRTDRQGDRQRVPVPQALLLEVMELREALAEARASAPARVCAMVTDVRGRRERAMSQAAAALEAGDPDAAAPALVSVRYYDRFLDEAGLPVSSAEAAHGG